MTQQKKKKKSNLLIYILGLIVIAGIVGLMFFKKNSSEEGLEVETEKVEKRTIREMVGASGKVFPETEVKISSDVSGEIVELYVEEGDSVKVGQVLARINPDTYVSEVERGRASVNSSKASVETARANIQSSKAQIQQIEAQLVNARKNHARNTDLLKDGVISQVEFDGTLSTLQQLEANLSAAKAGVASAEQQAKSAEYSVQSSEATLRQLNTSLDRTTILSPTNGIVSLLNVEKGERVVGTIQMAGTEMMRIANLNAMEAQVDVSENDILRVKIGDSVSVEVDAYLDRKFAGVVTEIANSASGLSNALTSDQVTNFEVKIQIDPNSYADLIQSTGRHAFRPGMSCSVDINTKTLENVVSVPIQAVTTRPKDSEKDKKLEDVDEDDLIEVVFAMNADTAVMYPVKSGIQDDDYIYIIEGIDDGMEVVTAPYSVVSKKIETGKKLERKNKKDEKKTDS